MLRFNYNLTDDETVRRRLDAAGTDYLISVTLLNHTFDLAVDIKANRRSTVEEASDEHGVVREYDIPGKLWNQCDDQDFEGNTSRIDARKLGHKSLPMQRALISQIRMQYPGELEKLCEAQGLTLDELFID